MTLNQYFKTFTALIALGVSSQALALGPGFGIKAGIPYSKSKTDGVGGASYEFGNFLVGAALDFSGGLLGVNIDLLYGQRKMGIADNTSVKVQEFKVPAVLYVDLLPIRLMAGGYYSRGLGNADLKIGDLPAVETEYSSLGVKKNDYGLVAGLGAVLPAGLFDVSLEARYNHGLANVRSGGGTTKNSSFEFLAGILF